MTPSPDRQDPPPAASPTTITQYQILATRRQAFDTLMWQVPALSLTAQSFLLSLAYGSQSTSFAAAVAGLLSVAVSAMSIQLLLRQRQNEVTDSLLLHRIEQEHGWQEIFATGEVRARNAGRSRRRVIQIRSYRIWTGGLALFGIAGFVAFLRAVL
ncbi:hypothetical protein SD37_06355 [Amycolatopsis orientalis]|uniref:Uncharacterized protein n=1 Tax=Amycolatopsis orientalis TaxID=31958 RepID=A0A193BSX2_AMYOR|nr:hypothetical protein [Amycolatopsis orientalis]ANN15316.1 hypothetical protein SD37_06355 [Amycolatopsis orientalis]